MVPDDAEVLLSPLDADLEAEPASRVAVDLAHAKELDEPPFQGTADIVAELGRVLVPATAGGRPDRGCTGRPPDRLPPASARSAWSRP